MLEIVRGRHWVVAHTVLDGENGPPTDLSQFSAIVCHIREKIALRNRQGFFEHKLVATPAVSFSQSVYYLKLSVAAVKLLHTGDYTIDVVAQNPDGSSESLLDPEPVRVVNRPSQPIVVVVEPPPPPPVQPPNPDPTPGGEPPPDVTPPPPINPPPPPPVPVLTPTWGPGPGPFPSTIYGVLPLGVLRFTIDGSVAAFHGQTARFSFWHSGDTDKRANGVCYSVNNGPAVFVRGGFLPTSTDNLDLMTKLLPVPWFPAARSAEAMFEVVRTPNVDQAVRVWAANSVTTPATAATTQITAFEVTCGRWKDLNFKYATGLVQAAFTEGVHNGLDIAGAFTSAGRANLKSLIVHADHQDDAHGIYTFSAFTGLRRLAFSGNLGIIGVRAAGLALQIVPTERRFLTNPSIIFGCSLSDAALNQLYTDLSAVPNNGKLLIGMGTGGSDETIATSKGYEIFSSFAELNDYINTRNNL